MDVCYIDKAQRDAVYSLEHLFLDAVPLSLTKWQAVRALFPEARRAEYIFPLAAYTRDGRKCSLAAASG